MTMNADWLLSSRDTPELLQDWLVGLGVRDAERAGRDFRDLIERAGAGCLDVIALIAAQLQTLLPRCPEPGMALSNLERYIAAVPRPEPHTSTS